jgi:hypothetical protein
LELVESKNKSFLPLQCQLQTKPDADAEAEAEAEAEEVHAKEGGRTLRMIHATPSNAQRLE